MKDGGMQQQIVRAQRIAREVLDEYPPDADLTEVYEEYRRRVLKLRGQDQPTTSNNTTREEQQP